MTRCRPIDERDVNPVTTSVTSTDTVKFLRASIAHVAGLLGLVKIKDTLCFQFSCLQFENVH